MVGAPGALDTASPKVASLTRAYFISRESVSLTVHLAWSEKLNGDPRGMEAGNTKVTKLTENSKTIAFLDQHSTTSYKSCTLTSKNIAQCWWIQNTQSYESVQPPGSPQSRQANLLRWHHPQMPSQRRSTCWWQQPTAGRCCEWFHAAHHPQGSHPASCNCIGQKNETTYTAPQNLWNDSSGHWTQWYVTERSWCCLHAAAFPMLIRNMFVSKQNAHRISRCLPTTSDSFPSNIGKPSAPRPTHSCFLTSSSSYQTPSCVAISPSLKIVKVMPHSTSSSL